MGLGLYLHGDCEKPRDALLEELLAHVRATHGEVLLSSHVGVDESGQRALQLGFHPAEDALELRALRPGRLVASARTSGAGPGYHAFVCELLDELGEKFAIRWQGPDPTAETGDETGYFHARDRSKLEAEMRSWLRAVGGSLRSREPAELTGVAIAMPHGPLYEVPGVATALGPRDAAWWSAIDGDDAAAESFFSWWEHGTGAGYLLGRTLCRMWCDIRWRTPRTPDETQMHDEVLELLKRAYALDPTRAYPFAEWAELLALRGEVLPAGAAASGAPTIGYHRGAMFARPFPGASVRVPGCFSVAYDKNGSWRAWEEGRTVWVSLAAAAHKPDAPAPEDQPEPKHETYQEGGAPRHKVSGKRVRSDAGALRVLFVTIVFTSEEHSEWARDTYRSVHFD